MRRLTMAAIAALVLITAGTTWAGAPAASISGELRVWHRVTVTVDGPASGEDATPNPFTDYRMTVTFTKGDRKVAVPGYFAADGNAGETGATKGNKWRAHFVPDEPGVWQLDARIVQGGGAALAAGAGGQQVLRVGKTLTVKPADPKAPGYLGKGMLRYVGKHHLQFAGSKEYYLKGGADSPENFLGYWQFDGTRDAGGMRRKRGLTDGLHRYGPHVKHWRRGDPTWRGGKGKGIIGALNYLAAKGVNSVYFLTYNIDGGDGRDTWMWTSPKERKRFDCSKLDQWEIVFSHMDRLGMQLHVVTQEAENDRSLDRGRLGDVRKLYYRELVARFGHHLAVLWNLGEENNNSNQQRKAFAAYIRALDPYDHPITVHTSFGQAGRFYNGLLGDPNFEATSIQGGAKSYNALAVSLRERTAKAGRPWCIYGDEQGPSVKPSLANLNQLRAEALWGNLMGGGAGVEWYFGYQSNFGDLQTEDFTLAGPLWDQTRHAVEFFQKYLPFADMTSANKLVSGKGNLCLAKAGGVYAVYLPSGGEAKLTLPAGRFSVAWYNPRTGGVLRTGSVTVATGPGAVSLGRPPAEAGKDWAVLVRKPSAGKAKFRFGVIADVQVADYEKRGNRDYPRGYASLAKAVEDLNGRDLAFVIQLGDLVDSHEIAEGQTQTPLAKVLPIYNRLRAPTHHVIGNHDKFKFDRGELVEKLGMPSAYYHFALAGWRFVVLDGTDAGYGALGGTQKQWLRRTLRAAAAAGERVIVLSHFPARLNQAEGKAPDPVLRLIREPGNVVAYLAGHHHRGGYARAAGIHHVTIQGMVEAPQRNAYAVVEVYDDRLEIRGVGKVTSRTLKLSAMVKEVSL